MRVLMTTDGVGGVFSYTLTLAEELVRRGARVDVATMGPALRPAQRAALHALAGVTVHESTFALEWMDDPWAEVEQAGEWLLGLERKIRPAIVHLNGYVHGAAGFSAPVVVVAHSCVLSWWEAVRHEPAPAQYERYRLAVARGLGAADMVIAPSAAMSSEIVRRYGRPRRIVVVPNGLRPGTAAAASEPAPTKDPFILSAGRTWDAAKNVAAVARLASRLPWPVAIAGEVDAPDGSQIPLHDVTAYGWLPADELAAVMDRASIFVLPVRYEPFGLTALEAAAHGCALVLGDIPSQLEIWGDAAVLVDPEDDDAIEQAITRLAHDGEMRCRLGDRARARSAELTAKRNADETLAAYARAARGARGEDESPGERRSSCG
jgi:glycosyltransferase involved in cell wall biosynthesis